MNIPQMLCIGAAAQDVFLTGEVFTPLCEDGVCYEHLKLGDKLSVDGLTFATGGNAMNAAVTFARQGLNTSYIGLLGNDPAGQAILAELDNENIHTEHVITDAAFSTKYSVILLAPNGERTILNYQGDTLASRPNSIAEKHVTGDWLYISSVGSMDLLEQYVTYAKNNGMKIAFNPASSELKEVQRCADLFNSIDLLALNKDEAQLFAEGTTTQELAAALLSSVETVLVSDGPNGAVAADSASMLSAGLYEDVPVIDRTGAGDAFTSGFVASVARGSSLRESLIFASANSTSVVMQIGAKPGILHKGATMHDMPITDIVV